MYEQSAAAQSIWRVGLRGLCPRCGRGKLFCGFLKLAPKCNACGLDFAFADPADGPAFFVMMTMAFPATGFGMWIELGYNPPLWVAFGHHSAVPAALLHSNPASDQGCAGGEPVYQQGGGGSAGRTECRRHPGRFNSQGGPDRFAVTTPLGSALDVFVSSHPGFPARFP